MRYSIELGDSSYDGHGITETVYVNIPESFTSAQLSENYAANVAKLGFGYHSIANDPEYPTISREQITALEEEGMRFAYADYSHKLADSLLKETRPNQNVVVLEKEPSGSEDESYYFFEEDFNFTGFVRIIMFMIGNGLPDFVWERDNVEAKVLIGMSSHAVSPHSAGYGLFGN